VGVYGASQHGAVRLYKGDAGSRGEKTVSFALAPSQPAFLTKKREHEWKIEKGEFTVMVGAAADDIRLAGSFTVTADRFLPGKNRKFYTLGRVI